MTSVFITSIESAATTVEQDVVSAAKTTINYIDNVFTTDFDPALVAAWQLIERNGGSLILAAAGNVLPSLATGQWGTAVTNLLADAKAAGATTVTAEEQLAGSTALQIVQAAQTSVAAAVAPPAPAAPATA